VRRAIAGAFADAAEKARSGVSVEVGKRECIVDLQINVLYGYSIPNIINEVRKKVAARLLEFTSSPRRLTSAWWESMSLPQSHSPRYSR
jgi:uncharacterized alkaline shock family protein YloU